MNIKRLFPVTDYTKLQCDTEGLYSITNPIEAEQISNLIKSNFLNNSSLNILDGNGGLGGNTFNFSKNFKHVTTCEINEERYIMLVNNINQYNLQNVKTLNIDSINYLFENYDNYDVYFFDPPWGGPDYKNKNNLRFNLGNYTLNDLIKKIKNNKDKPIIFKLPNNYDLSEFSYYNYNIIKIKNYIIIIIN